MKKYLAIILVTLTVLYAPASFAQKQPIFLNRVEPERLDKCTLAVIVRLADKIYALPRLKSMEYSGADGKMITNQDPGHVFNNCDIQDLGEVRRVITGTVKPGLSFEAEIVPENKKATYSTYATYKTQIEEALGADKYELMPGNVMFMKWQTSFLYLLPRDINPTGNGEPVAIYCKLPAGVNANDPKQKKICSARYILPDGMGFGYSYLQFKQYEPTSVDLENRQIFEKYAVREKKAP